MWEVVKVTVDNVLCASNKSSAKFLLLPFPSSSLLAFSSDPRRGNPDVLFSAQERSSLPAGHVETYNASHQSNRMIEWMDFFTLLLYLPKIARPE